jgi:hypothetical protein|mmetsp:Transcript_10855/g.14623  ORF Transcript_10855/g.14623 Transcript_10855/m.14623 type:complete len:136 (+) Transcript_10855:573-980(+)
MLDRFKYDEQRVNFFYNSDPECRRLRDLDPEKGYIVIYNGENSIPFILELGKDEISLRRLIFEVTVSVVRGTPRWGQRGHSAVFDHFMSALIYMIPEHRKPEEMQHDWQVMLMVRMIEMIQEQQTGFVPFITPFI